METPLLRAGGPGLGDGGGIAPVYLLGSGPVFPVLPHAWVPNTARLICVAVGIELYVRYAVNRDSRPVADLFCHCFK